MNRHDDYNIVGSTTYSETKHSSDTVMAEIGQKVPQSNVGYTEKIKPMRKKESSLKKVVASALIISLVGAPLLGVGLGFGSTLGSEYLKKFKLAGATASTVESKLPIAQNVSTANLDIVDIVKNVEPAIVNITTELASTEDFYSYFFESEPKTALGTGIAFKEDDQKVYIMTNYHVIEGASTAYISFKDQEQIPAYPVGKDATKDVAVISVNKSDLAKNSIEKITLAKLGDSSNLQVGETVIAIGNALGRGKTATTGIISGLNKELEISSKNTLGTLIQTDAAINPGNSGGALVNLSGEVIGMNTAKISTHVAEGMGFAIPMKEIQTVIEGIFNADSATSTRPFIGIKGVTVDKELQEEYGIMVSEGVLLTEECTENSGASDAGLRRSDIIIEFANNKVKSIDQLQEIVKVQKVGTKVPVKIIRNNHRELEVMVEVKDISQVQPW